MNMKESATMTAQTETPKAKKSAQVSTTVSPEKYAALEDYRWENRVNKLSDVIGQAVDLFIETKGIKVAGGEVAAPAAPEKPAKA
jgi:tRNA A37 methylthiotransferase MiaB